MKYALITGGSRGIGRAIAVRLAQDGYVAVVNYQHNQEAAEETLRQIEEKGGKGELLPFDVSDKASVTAALQQWQTAHDGEHIDVLVLNAGIRRDGLLVFMEDAQWQEVIDTSLNGFFYLSRAIVPAMVTSRYGRIVVISSLSGVTGMAGQANYSAAKSALIGGAKALAKEVASRKVTVNVIAPGFVATDMTADLDEKELKKTIPAGRFGQPEEVAALASFLASDEAAYITGQVIEITGGL